MPAVKIGTCQYCGTRAALVLSGESRHELACSTCGAPLHDLKMMPKPQTEQPRPTPRARPASSHDRAMSRPEKKREKYKKPKKKKSLKQRAWGEIWDFVEDIID